MTASNSPMTSVMVSAIPGRIRLRHPRLRSKAALDTLAEDLVGLDGALAAEGKTVPGSILFLYDSSRVDPGLVERRVEDLARHRLGLDADPAEPAEPAGQETEASPGALALIDRKLRRHNRAIKVGMLASIVLSLLALGTGKRAHALLGIVFLLFLALHLAGNRRAIV